MASYARYLAEAIVTAVRDAEAPLPRQLYLSQEEETQVVVESVEKFAEKWKIALRPGNAEGVVCPFCGEEDFDVIGLKGHLEYGDCLRYKATGMPARFF